MPEDERWDTSDDARSTESPSNEPSDRDRSQGISFSLPPIRLPPLFPDHLEIRLPVPGFRYATRLSSGWVLLVALGFDVADALLVGVTTGPVGLVRTLGGLVLAGTLTRWVGLLYAWEVVAVLLGYSELTVLPSLAGVLLLWLWLGRRREK